MTILTVDHIEFEANMATIQEHKYSNDERTIEEEGEEKEDEDDKSQDEDDKEMKKAHQFLNLYVDILWKIHTYWEPCNR